MLTSFLRTVRRSLRGQALRKPLEALGIVALGRSIYHKQLIGKGEHGATLMGVPLRFAVSSEREIARIDAGYLEEEFVTRLIDCLRQGDVVYDIGANIGMVTLLVAGRAAQAGKKLAIHAFEPEPRNFDHLKRNAALNNFGTVTCHRIALASKDATGQLFIDGEAGTGTHSIVSQDAHGRTSIPIELRNGAAFAREINAPPTVVKIDVEGAEMEVLEGLRPLLESKQIREILIEVHPESLKASGAGADAVERMLLPLGYKRVWSQHRGEEVHEHYQAPGT
jgi:FkbM family methyltransferase